MNRLLDVAQSLRVAGISFVPALRNKKPACKWKAYQSQIPTKEEAESWFGGNGRSNTGIAVICGEVSGSLLCFDFDAPELFEPWCRQIGGMKDRLAIQQTGGGGFQVFLRCPNPGGNDKLAWVVDEGEPTGRSIGIETRGEGGYALIPPSLHPSGQHYRWIQGDLNTLSFFSQDEADRLFQAARSFDVFPEEPKEEEEIEPLPLRPRTGEEESVIVAFNHRYSITEVLQWYGYAPTSDRERMKRPNGTSGSVWIHEEKSFHHSSNDALNDGHAHDPFDVFCLLEHGGDPKKAAKAAAEKLGLSRPVSAPKTPAAPKDSEEEETPDEIRDRLLKAKDTALGNAERMRERYGQDLAHHPSLGWFAWNGQHWERDSLLPLRLYREMSRNLFVEAAADETKTREARWKWAKRSESKATREETFAWLESESGIRVAPEVWDANPFLIGVKNGVLDLATGSLREGRREDRISLVIPVAYDPDALCPLWLAFLDRIMAGDKEMVAFLQRAAGYTLTGSIQEQVMFILHGCGSNGKSTFTTTLLALMGDLGRTIPSELLTVRKYDGSAAFELAPLAMARMALAAEAEEGKKLAESRVKDMTGGERINACYKFLDPFEFSPHFKIWYTTNHLPQIRGTDEGIWRRICKIPFEVHFSEKEKDVELPAKLRNELPGILAWAVEGCQIWRANRLQPPQKVQDATAEYRVDQDLLSAFLEECCTTGENDSVPSRDLYRIYTRYCDEAGEMALSQRRLAGRLQDRGFKNEHKEFGALWKGIGLQAEPVEWLLSEANREGRRGHCES